MERYFSLPLILFALFSVSVIAAPGEIYITFLATPTDLPSTPGHTFSCIELHLNYGIKEDCFGFYPKSGKDVLNGEGVVEKELSLEKTPDRFAKVSVSMRHKIDDGIRKAIYAEVQKWSGSNYDLIVKNCGDMVFAVAAVAGLLTPARSTVLLPTQFVSGLANHYWRGQWSTSDPGSRFALSLDGAGRMQWIERNPSGGTLGKTVDFSPKDGEATIYRENNANVLTFLGFQTTIRNEILAAGPKPSYLRLKRAGRRIEAEWNGLTVIKDANAHLKEINQPGTTPAKSYTFDRN